MAVIYYKANNQWVPINTLISQAPLGQGYLFGDSFVYGRNGDTNPATTQYPLHTTINKLIGANLVNKGLGGGIGYVKQTNDKKAYDVINETDLTNADFCILCYGTNDYQEAIGTTSTSGTILYELNRCCTNIFTRKKDCRVVIVAPWQQTGAYDAKPDGNDHSKAELAAAMKTYCESNFIPYISMQNNPINPFNATTLIGTDGNHPTDRGYVLLGQWLAGELSKVIGP